MHDICQHRLHRVNIVHFLSWFHRRYCNVGQYRVYIVSRRLPFMLLTSLTLSTTHCWSTSSLHRFWIITLLFCLHGWCRNVDRHRVDIVSKSFPVYFVTSSKSQCWPTLSPYRVYIVFISFIVAVFRYAMKHMSCWKYNLFIFNIAEMYNNDRLVRNTKK